MNNSNQKIGQYLFMGILFLHVLGCYVMGFSTLINPKFSIETGFKIPYNFDIQILALIIGMELLFLGSIALLGLIWTKRKSVYGIYTGTAVGLYMFAFGIVAFLKFGTTDGLLVDSIRGFLTLVFAYMAYNELKNSDQKLK